MMIPEINAFQINHKKYRICCCHVQYLAFSLAALEMAGLVALIGYSSYSLHESMPNSGIIVSWPTVIAISSISLFFTALMCIGVFVGCAILLVAQMSVQAIRLVLVIVYFIVYVIWNAKRRRDRESYSSFVRVWLIATLSFVAVAAFHVLYFGIISKTYKFLSSRQRSVQSSETNRDVRVARRSIPGSEIDARTSRISLVEELFSTPQCLSLHISERRRRSVLKIPKYVRQTVENIGVYPILPAQYHYKPPSLEEFRKWAVPKRALRK